MTGRSSGPGTPEPGAAEGGAGEPGAAQAGVPEARDSAGQVPEAVGPQVGPEVTDPILDHEAPLDPTERRSILADALGVAVATGAYGISFGAISVAAGLDLFQTLALSLFMFTGGSQFALVGVIAGGGNPVTGAATAIMLGARNSFYGLRLASLLQVHGVRRWGAAHLVIDETTAMAVGRRTRRAARLGFYATGVSLFLLWNVGTAVGALSADLLSDPRVLGLDVAAPAAFLALLAPQVAGREPVLVALAGALVAVAAVPFVPAGVPVLIAAGVAVLFGVLPRRSR